MAASKNKSIKTTKLTITATATANIIDITCNRILWTPIKITAENITMTTEQQTKTKTTILLINKQINRQIYTYTKTVVKIVVDKLYKDHT